MLKNLIKFSLIASLATPTIFLNTQPTYAESPQIENISIYNTDNLEQRAGISGQITIEKTKYKWIETSFGGTHRGLTFNPGKHIYKLSPNPHDDPWYNKNQVKFYNQVAAQVETQGNTGKWHSKGWPNKITKIKVNKIDYTLTVQ